MFHPSFYHQTKKKRKKKTGFVPKALHMGNGWGAHPNCGSMACINNQD